MQFEPKTEKQLREEMLMPPDEYDATVIEAEDATSKKGNPMIALVLRVYRKDGRTAQLRDWLMPTMGLKLLFFCEAAGLKDKYASGDVTADDCHQRDVRVKVGIRKDATGQYPDQNTVLDYIPRGATTEGKPASPVADKVFEEAEIPF